MRATVYILNAVISIFGIGKLQRHLLINQLVVFLREIMMRATWHVLLVHLTFDVLHASLRLVNVYKNVSCIYDFKHLI